MQSVQPALGGAPPAAPVAPKEQERAAVVIHDDDEGEIIHWTEDANRIVLVEEEAVGDRRAGPSKNNQPILISCGDGVGDQASAGCEGEVIIERWSEIPPTFQCRHCTLINVRSQLSLSMACTACAKPRWNPGEDEDLDDPDYAPPMDVEDIEDTIDEAETSQDPSEVQREVAALEMEQYMSIVGLLEHQGVPVDELLALYGKDELTEDSDAEGSNREDGGERDGAVGEPRDAAGVIPYYPSLRYAVPARTKR